MSCLSAVLGHVCRCRCARTSKTRRAAAIHNNCTCPLLNAARLPGDACTLSFAFRSRPAELTALNVLCLPEVPFVLRFGIEKRRPTPNAGPLRRFLLDVRNSVALRCKGSLAFVGRRLCDQRTILTGPNIRKESD